MNKILSLFVLSLYVLLVGEDANAYEVIDIKAGGAIQGKVLMKGSLPQDETLPIPEGLDSCTPSQKAEKYRVSEDGGVKNVVVWIHVIEKGKAVEKKDVKISTEGCKFIPRVNIGYVGGQFLFENHDHLLHQAHLAKTLPYQKKASRRPLFYGATIYNVALPIAFKEVAKEIKPYHRYTEDLGYINVICNRHAWMQAYVFIFDHPYAVLTGDQGNFEIKDIPAGKYTLKFWHEGLKEKEMIVEIKEGETQQVQMEMEK
jgi:hypothetical protein